MLQVCNLHKSYGSRAAVTDLSFTAKPGEIVGLLGPNGAGKTTTVLMLCGLVAPDAGQVRIGDQPMRVDADAVKRRIGLVPQELALYEDLSALANLELFGALYGLAGKPLRTRSMAALEQVGLAERAADKPATFSGGMKRRLNIACALVHDPDVLLLDEPTTGVDPQSRNAIFDNLEALKRAGKTLLYTTHYMEEAERLCDRIVIVDHGRVIADDTLSGLYRLLPAVEELIIELEGTVEMALLATEPGIRSVRQSPSNGRLVLGIDDLTATAPGVLAWLTAHGHRLRAVHSGHATLETVFLALTGRQLRD